MRAFISIGLPDDIRADVFHTFEKLSSSGLVLGNFVDKSNLHLTLKFLGEITESQAIDVESKLNEINFSNFGLSLGDFGFSPSENHIKIIWVELVGEGLVDLHKEIDEKLSELGFITTHKEFVPHLTIARVKEIRNKDLFNEKLKKIHLKKKSFAIEGFDLMKSELMREGPVYKNICEFRFG